MTAICETIKALAPSLAQGELEGAQARALKEHAATCQACQKTLSSMDITLRSLDSIPRHVLAQDLSRSVMNRIQASPAPEWVKPRERAAARPAESPWAWLFKPWVAPALAGACAMGAVLLLAWPGSRPPAVARGPRIPLVSEEHAAGPTFTVAALSGHAEVFDGSPASEVREGMAFSMGCEVKTSSLSTLKIRMADGSRVTVKGSSVLVPRDRKVELKSGSARFEVAKRDGKSFTVGVPHGSITVMGTIFDVNVALDRTLVDLLEGKVKLANDGGELVLKPGDHARIARAGAPETLGPDQTATGAHTGGGTDTWPTHPRENPATGTGEDTTARQTATPVDDVPAPEGLK